MRLQKLVCNWGIGRTIRVVFSAFGVVFFMGLPSYSAEGLAISSAPPREALESPALYFQLNSPTVREISDEELYRINPSFRKTEVIDFGQCDQGQKRDSEVNPLEELNIFVDQIINIGKKVWNVVAAGKPVANFKTDVAYALPKGVSCWTQLSSWSVPVAKNYQVVYRNKFGVEVIQFTYQLTYTYGGKVGELGAYLTNATVLPAHINVAWGFSFDAKAEVPSVFNVGSSSQPVGAMQVNVMWKVENVLTHEQVTNSYFVNGLGEFQKL
jgi:hypothetical protein